MHSEIYTKPGKSKIKPLKPPSGTLLDTLLGQLSILKAVVRFERGF